MPKPKTSEVWLVRFPFSDLTTTKLRPALVLAVHGEDVIVLGLFSRIPDKLRPTWVLIEDGHPQFGMSGLSKVSLLKAEKIAVVHESVFQRHLGVLPADLIVKAHEALRRALLLN